MRKLRKTGLLRDSVSLRLQNADIGQIPVVFIVVKAIATTKALGMVSDVIGLQGDAGTAALGLIQQDTQLQGGGMRPLSSATSLDRVLPVSKISSTRSTSRPAMSS